MFLRRALPAFFTMFMLIALLGACSVSGGDDDDEGEAGPGPNQPTSTRVVVMSTFTPTEVVPPAGKTATEEAQLQARIETETAAAGLPTPTPAVTELPEEDLLWPPRTRLEAAGKLTEGYLGSYSWQFSDDIQTFGAIDSQITALNQGDPVEIQNGDTLTIRYYGEEYRSPPLRLDVAIYDFESNSAIPVGPGGEQGEGLAFSVRTAPIQSMQIDPANPTITIGGFSPGHYVIRAQGHWGDHPVIARPLFVTWLYDIEIGG